MQWSELYDEKLLAAGAQVEFADVGCGYGGLLGRCLFIKLSTTRFLAIIPVLSRAVSIVS